MIVACSTSAFDTPLPDALARIAAIGFHHVDLIAIPGWPHVIPADLVADFDTHAERVRESLTHTGLTPIAMNSAYGHPHQRDPELVEKRLREVDAAARLATSLGIRVVAFYPGYKAVGRDWDEVLADSVVSMREMVAAAASASGGGVTLAVELHGATPFENVEQGKRLLAAMPELKVAYDPTHFAFQGIDVRETEPFIERAVQVHLRGAAKGRLQCPVAESELDFAWVCDALKRNGFRGNVSIEYLPKYDGDVEAEIRKLRDVLEAKLG